MTMKLTRRQILAAVAAAAPAVAVGRAAQAWTPVSAESAKFPVATGVWKVLEHATDGTDPSTALETPPAANFTPEIKALEGKEITLSGYLTPVSSGGFGKKSDYLLSRENFHCPYCYVAGRGSLALAQFDAHVPPTSGKVTIKGMLALQDKDPSDFYFQIKGAKLA
jgi:hypothetical protein